MKVVKKLRGIIKIKSNDLTSIVGYNILISYLFNGLGLLISFITVPLLIKLLTENQYGIWLTLFSILTWLTILDFGFGLGLRNKLPEALINKEKEKATYFIEFTYFLTFILAVLFLLIAILLNFIFDYYVIFNLKVDSIPENFSNLVLFFVFLFGFQFVGNNINGLLHAIQNSRLTVFIDFLSKAIMLVGILLMLTFKNSSLYLLALVTIGGRVFIMLGVTMYLKKKLRINNNIKFSLLSFKNLNKKKKLFFEEKLHFLSSNFFLINLSAIFLIHSVNYLITYLYTPAEVVPFNISFKLFSSLLFLFYVFLAPFWSALTEAFHKRNFIWITKALNKMLLGYLVFFLITLIIYFLSDYIYDLWIGETIIISRSITFSVFIYVSIMAWNALFAHFLNGINKLKIQLNIALIHIFTNIPLAILLAKYFNYGVEGLIWATNINLLLLSIFLPIEVFKIKKKIKNNDLICVE